MSKEFSDKIVNYFKNKPVKKAFLFGSVSRNENDDLSDVDILVELDYSQPIGLGFVRMKLELEDLLKRKVDLLTSNSVSKYIKPFIDSEKILIYEK
ncbi:MAG: nucleotidyltransferase [Ignavibacteria bacterium CG2_30_36_16]|nr:nucleotidyltransferase [Ignavibacteria bacterium]OIP61773.1 MAG: nucleotidyltransferase [Ignavibacteria bacterium CG2_30_36_16]PIQ07566.1 MAG: nucleotidyltransferase [Ignavibacteriales bacterium CG18_big_fil_WC_8_21_14_2_50_31_20]PJB01680.1 MAG: nucleotidyltransferase [Ignavibacteria bacterium CG_4_9_14_3_um_filter_36_18]